MAYFGTGTNVDYLIQQYIRNNGLLKHERLENHSLNGQYVIWFPVPSAPTYISFRYYADGDYWVYTGFGGLGNVTGTGYYEGGEYGSTATLNFTYSGGYLNISDYTGISLSGNLVLDVFYTP